MSNKKVHPMFVIKRDGRKERFKAEKIKVAISAAISAAGEAAKGILTDVVYQCVLEDLATSKNEVLVEDIQELIEKSFLKYGDVAYPALRSFVVYRERRIEQNRQQRSTSEVLDAVNSSHVDVFGSINEYVDRSDWRVSANANQGYSLGGLILNTSGKLVANYWLNHIYSKEISKAHREGDVHIHDLDVLSGYCAGWSLKTLLQEGFNGVPNRIESAPPKHMGSAVGQIVNFLGSLQNEWAGAQAFSSFDTYMAPFVKVDNLTYKQVKQHMQELIYSLNVPSRWGCQSPFSNLTFDWVCPEDLRDENPCIGGVEQPFTYGDLQAEMDMINRAYIEVMIEGDDKGRIFTFPIPTYNITDDFPWESENANYLFEMTAKYGLPYFQNFLNSDLNPNMVRSMCCRLQLDLTELLKRGNGLFGSAEQTGSIGVVTINMARVGYLSKSYEDLIGRLEHLLSLAKQSLEIKRKTIQNLMDAGLYPYSKRYLGTLRNHFSTIGVNGMNEMIRNFSEDATDITSTCGQKFASDILDFIRAKMVEFQEETGNMYNLEATPAEGTTYRFAKEDQKRFSDIIQAGSPDAPYYTNSSQLPVGYTTDVFTELDLQENLQRKYTGGTVIHLYMSERISSGKACMKLVRKVLSNYKIPYLTITPVFSICPKHGYIPGEHQFCPVCDEEIIAKKISEGSQPSRDQFAGVL